MSDNIDSRALTASGFQAFVYRRLPAVQIAMFALQVFVYVMDTWKFPGDDLLPLVPVFETFGPFILIPLFMWIRRLLPEELPRDLKILGKYGMILGFVTLASIVVFQALNWVYPRELHGGPFYFGSTLMSLIWGFRPVVRSARETRVD